MVPFLRVFCWKFVLKVTITVAEVLLEEKGSLKIPLNQFITRSNSVQIIFAPDRCVAESRSSANIDSRLPKISVCVFGDRKTALVYLCKCFSIHGLKNGHREKTEILRKDAFLGWPFLLA